MKKVQILGPGCPRCEQLYKQTLNAAAELDLDCDIEKVTDMQAILGYGVMSTPALVVDGQVRVAGRVPSPAQLKEMLQ
jgi:small redox-active disulfide protein 2